MELKNKWGKGMKKYMFVIIGFVVMGLADARAETCVGENWNVSYSCGDGAQAGTLPDDQVATYGSEFTPVMLTTRHCTPPSGKIIAGIEVWVGDEYNDVYSATAAPFLYYYASDVIIKPRYLGVADAESLWALRGVDGTRYTYQAAAQTWQVVFPYGTIVGVGACSNVKPQNTASGWVTGYVADDQNAIAEEGGQYCYCKMTEPNLSASPWVFVYDPSNVSICSSECAYRCGYNIRHSIFRASLFLGARSLARGFL
jgi:hypothetical protein